MSFFVNCFFNDSATLKFWCDPEAEKLAEEFDDLEASCRRIFLCSIVWCNQENHYFSLNVSYFDLSGFLCDFPKKNIIFRFFYSFQLQLIICNSASVRTDLKIYQSNNSQCFETMFFFGNQPILMKIKLLCFAHT